MSFANFFVAESEITKQFKGCYAQRSPLPSTIGILGGSRIQPGIQGVVPVPHSSIKNLWVFAGIDDGLVKMVGMDYTKGSSNPTRVDGRAFTIDSNTSPVLNSKNVSNYWNNANIKNVGSDFYSLTTSNNSPMKSVNACLQDASDTGSSMVGVTDINNNGLGYCLSGDGSQGGDTSAELLLNGVNEDQCLQKKNANTFYNIVKTPTLGKTFMGKKGKETNKMVFHEYPDSMLSPGNTYTKYSGFDSVGSDMSNGEIKDSTSDECKQYCINLGDTCKGFVYDSTQNICQMKNKIYPNENRKINKSLDIYTRMPKIKNNKSCPKGVQAVNTEFMKKGGLLSSDKMSMDFQCETEENTIEDLQGIEQAYASLTGELSGLRKENDTILKQFTETRQEIKDTSDNYEDTAKMIHKINEENPTIKKLLEDASHLQSVFSMRNTGFILAIILLSIFLLRVLRK